ncbi:MAG: peptide chain release factor N(5)-glutamine methyltransferase [Chlamydiota bacterium]
MTSLRETLVATREKLAAHGVPFSDREAKDLLALVLGCSRSAIYCDLERTLSAEEKARYCALVARRINREPFGYLAGKTTFLECDLTVNCKVLIPRQETEILVDQIIQSIAPQEEKTAWDLCCGSGCIGLAVKRARPNLKLTLADQSAAAIEVASQNARRHKLDVRLLVGDFLGPFNGEKTDYLFCNPPYLAEGDYRQTEPEVRRFEPKEALVAGQTGYEFFLRLASELPLFLHEGAKIFLEIGANQSKEVFKIFNKSYWKQVRCIKDWAGCDRFFFLEFSP